MENQNWIVDENGCYEAFDDPKAEAASEQVYRLYRFLTELEDLLAAIPDNGDRIRAIAPRVRKLLTSSYWLQMEYTQPKPEQGWSVKFLYREYQFPLTVQMVTWLPGTVSTIHNHATWGMVAMIGGEEKNTLWRRVPDATNPHKIEKVDELVLGPGDIIGLMPDAIHCVEPLGDEPTVSFNLYGVTDRSQRYRFKPEQQTAELF
ncbi:MAG: cupin [Cyanobacteria bacterium J06635_15]